MRSTNLWIVLALLSLFAACQEESTLHDPEDASPGLQGVEEPKENSEVDPKDKPPARAHVPHVLPPRVLPPSPKLPDDDPHFLLAKKLQEGLRGRLIARAQQESFPDALKDRLAAALDHAAKHEKDHPRDLRYAETLSAFHTEREFKSLLTQDFHLTPAANVILTSVQGSDSHGLKSSDYHAERLTDLSIRSNRLSNNLDDMPGLELFAPEIEGLAVYLKIHEELIDVGSEKALEDTLELLLSDKKLNPLPRLARAFQLYEENRKDLLFLSVELEVVLADALLHYSRDMAHRNLNRFTEAERVKFKIEGDKLHPKRRSPLILRRLNEELVAFSNFTTEEEARLHIKALWPYHPQYDKLRKAYLRYENIVQEGGWNKVPDGKLNPGGRAPRIELLKKRLSLEGFYTGPIDDYYDSKLVDAVKTYQKTHQFETTGTVEEAGFWRSLNTPAKKRLKQIKINILRWHRTRMVPSKHYVYINIPDFHAEVWKGNHRDMRFRIVTGSSRRECNPSTKRMTYVNSTPLMHAKLAYVVFNPFWNVPARIEQEEYLPEIVKNPKWLEENRFEYSKNKGGHVVFRQLPGKRNALGQVKFLFPNRHGVYLHDTPKKGLFGYPVRAFSHGCMRVQNPMKLAEYLVKGEGKWDEKAIKKMYKKKSTKEWNIPLDEPLDVFIEYFTTRVDDEGHIYFLADVYKFIHDEMNPHIPFRSKCTPGEKRKTIVRPPELLNTP